jgi:hypothetical protein
MRTSIDRLKQMAGSEAHAMVAYMEQVASRPKQSRRFFAVGFRDSNVRIVFPNDSDPLKFEQQVTADKVWGLQTIQPD